jgi:hypothetical protein
MNDELEHLFKTSANWEYKDPFTDQPFTFDSFWDPSLEPQIPNDALGRKRKRRPPLPTVILDDPSGGPNTTHATPRGSSNYAHEADTHGTATTLQSETAHNLTGGTASANFAHSAQIESRGSTASQAQPVPSPDPPSDLCHFY